MNRSLISAGSPEPGIFDLPRKLASLLENDVQVWFYTTAGNPSLVVVRAASLLGSLKNDLVKITTGSFKIFVNKAHLSWPWSLAFSSVEAGGSAG